MTRRRRTTSEVIDEVLSEEHDVDGDGYALDDFLDDIAASDVEDTLADIFEPGPRRASATPAPEAGKSPESELGTPSTVAEEFLRKRNERAAARPNPLAPVSIDDRSETERAVDEAVDAGRTGAEVVDDFLAKRNARAGSGSRPAPNHP